MIKKINFNGASHLSECINDLPANCIFNKVVTGCGGTTVALENNECYVIAVPTTELIINKLNITSSGHAVIKTHSGNEVSVFGWFGKQEYNTNKELGKYMHSEGVKKIMITYDKVNALTKMMKGIGVNPSDFKLLVDEYHILLKAYSYRMKAINGIFNNFKEFKSYTFMSATPISPDFCPDALKDVDVVEAEWDEVDTLKVQLEKTNKPYVKAAQFINLVKKQGYIEIEGKKSQHLYFFLNSVCDIMDIVCYCELDPSEVNIICADTFENKAKLGAYSLTNSKGMNMDAHFTFCTSKAFEGCDFFCEDALSIIVSNTRNKHTLLDISTDIPQIAGRIRDAKVFNNYLIHIFSTARQGNFDDMTEDKVKEGVEKVVSTNNKVVDFYNTLDEEQRIIMIEHLPSEYFELVDKHIVYNATLDRLKYYEYKVQELIYSNGIALKKAYTDSRCAASDINWSKVEGKLKRANCKKTFKEAFIEYAAMEDKESQEAKDLEALFMLDLNNSLIAEAFSKLGEDKVRSLKYSRPSVVMALDNLDSNRSIEAKITKAILDEFSLGFYSKKDLKAKLGTIFDSYKENNAKENYTKVSASDIANYFEVKEGKIRENGKQIAGFFLIAPKAITVSPKEEVIVEYDKQTKVDFEAIAYNEAIKAIEEEETKSSEFNPVDVVKSLYDKDFTISPKEIVEYLNEVHRFYGFEEQDVEQIINNIWDSL